MFQIKLNKGGKHLEGVIRQLNYAKAKNANATLGFCMIHMKKNFRDLKEIQKKFDFYTCQFGSGIHPATL